MGAPAPLNKDSVSTFLPLRDEDCWGGKLIFKLSAVLATHAGPTEVLRWAEKSKRSRAPVPPVIKIPFDWQHGRRHGPTAQAERLNTDFQRSLFHLAGASSPDVARLSTPPPIIPAALSSPSTISQQWFVLSDGGETAAHADWFYWQELRKMPTRLLMSRLIKMDRHTGP